MTATVPSPAEQPPVEQVPAPTPPEPVPTVLDRWSDPTLILIAAGLLALVSLLPWAVRSVVTLPLVLVLPGHALLASLDRPDRALSGGGRVALRVVTSLAIITLVVLGVGSLLDVSKLTVIGGLWAFTSIAALVGWNHDLPDAGSGRTNHWTQSGVLLAVTAVVAIVVVGAALLFLPEPRNEPYSRLSLTGTSQASGSPLRVRSGRTASVEVEVENGTSKTVQYRVIPAIDGGRAWEAPKIRLEAGERHTVTVKGIIPADACLSRLTLALSANGERTDVAPLVLYVRNEAGDACG